MYCLYKGPNVSGIWVSMKLPSVFPALLKHMAEGNPKTGTPGAALLLGNSLPFRKLSKNMIVPEDLWD